MAKTDTYSLSNTGMTTSYINGIARSGVSGTYIYTVNPAIEPDTSSTMT